MTRFEALNEVLERHGFRVKADSLGVAGAGGVTCNKSDTDLPQAGFDAGALPHLPLDRGGRKAGVTGCLSNAGPPG